MFALPVILIFTILLITIQIPIICTLYYSQNYMLKMLSIKLSINMESHPLRVRGLKPGSGYGGGGGGGWTNPVTTIGYGGGNGGSGVVILRYMGYK